MGDSLEMENTASEQTIVDEEESLEESHLEVEFTDLKFRHVLVPSIFGMVLGASANLLFDTFVMQAGLLSAVLFSPLIAFLTKTKIGWEHSLGLAVVSVVTSVIWLLGFNYFNTLAIFFAWVWMCSSWWKYDLPPFRYGFWHGFGIAFSTFIGGILSYNLF